MTRRQPIRRRPPTRRPTTIAAMPDRPPATDAPPSSIELDPLRADPRAPAAERFGWHPEPALLGIDDAASSRPALERLGAAARGCRARLPLRRGAAPVGRVSRRATPSSAAPSTPPTRPARATVRLRRRSGRRRPTCSWPSSGRGSRRTSSTRGTRGRSATSRHRRWRCRSSASCWPSSPTRASTCGTPVRSARSWRRRSGAGCATSSATGPGASGSSPRAA